MMIILINMKNLMKKLVILTKKKNYRMLRVIIYLMNLMIKLLRDRLLMMFSMRMKVFRILMVLQTNKKNMKSQLSLSKKMRMNRNIYKK